MPSVLVRRVAEVRRPHHYMSYVATDFVIASGAAVDLDGPRARNRHDDVFIAVRTGLHALLPRQRP
ncbi:hypothetical protein A5715_17060 [Mycolicibacter heraklionensis]|nr:hypothetical protein A5715_17060 [Mycolicibacter heraklionensis]